MRLRKVIINGYDFCDARYCVQGYYKSTYVETYTDTFMSCGFMVDLLMNKKTFII